MKILARIVLMSMSALLLGVADAQEHTSTVNVGDTVITLSTPKGYFRIDGKNDKIDSVLQASVGKSIRLLAWYGTEVALAETLAGKMSFDRGVSFRAVTGMDDFKVKEENFQKLKDKILADSTAFVDGVDAKRMERTGTDAASILGMKIAKLKVGQKISLGVFDQGADSVSYSMLLRLETRLQGSDTTTSYVYISAHSDVLIRNRLVSFSCGSIYHNASDLDLVRKSLKEWKDSILRLNKQ